MAKKVTPRPALDAQMKAADYASIGKFIVAWNQAEALVDAIVLWTLGVGNTTTEAIMGSSVVAHRADIFVAVVQDRISDDALVESAVKCAKKMKGLSDFRNAVAHGRWAFHIDLRAPSSRRKSSTGEDVTISKIKTRYAEVCVLTHQLADLARRLPHWEPQPSRR